MPSFAKCRKSARRSSIVLSLLVVALQSWRHWSPVGTLAVLAFLTVGSIVAAAVSVVIGQGQLVPMLLLAAWLSCWTAIRGGQRTKGGQS